MFRLSEKWQRRLDLRLWAVLAGAVLVLLCPLLEAFYWRFGLLTHFRVQLVLGIALLVLVAVLFRSWRVLAGAVLVLGVAAWPVLGMYTDSSRHTGRGDISIGAMNVLTSNQDYAAALAAIRERQPDLMLVMETDAGWRNALESLRDLYPHILSHPRPDNFGITLLSRQQPEAAELVSFGNAGVPSVVARVRVAGAEIHFIGTHPLPPASSNGVAYRDRQLRDVAEYVAGLDPAAHVVVAGDLNTTPFAPAFRELLRTARLHDTAQGFGYQPTWPAGFPLAAIPIDHILVSGSLRVAARSVGPSVGSDHYPVWVTLSPAKP